MGAVPAADDLIVVKLLSTCGGEPTINDLSFRIVNPAATWADQITQVHADLDNAIGLEGAGVWSAARSTAYNLYAMQVVDVRPGTSPLVERLVSYQGVVADDVMPPNDSLCVTRTTVQAQT
jgi:hypothetical protein